MKKQAGLLFTLATIGGMFAPPERSRKMVSVSTPREKPVPSGCQRYYYNKEGICCKSESEVHFDALKPSNAHKKYERWQMANGETAK